ncbi:hypothetical protein JCM12296A_53680 [Desulfosarcina cetonica]|uniref:hypothetical protein n=1 Tax=Desulfosarcina cetonica TaxID=90730 RepID=UPI001C46E54E|nr:hypothetical protein [Desulfosarcina cetonica]
MTYIKAKRRSLFNVGGWIEGCDLDFEMVPTDEPDALKGGTAASCAFGQANTLLRKTWALSNIYK